jgi:pyruvate dehydrogenase complex dehydrogenase (E1) component
LGGHVSTYASAAWLYEIGFNHFFRGKDGDGSGDQLFLQGHASPGIWPPGENSPEVLYLHERRAALGGPLPVRRVIAKPLPEPPTKPFEALEKGFGHQGVATTMALVRLVKDLMRDQRTGARWVPTIPDEARTFGMESMFPTAGIYSPLGQNYDPVDADQLLYYKECKTGQLIRSSRASPKPVQWPSSPPRRPRTPRTVSQ